MVDTLAQRRCGVGVVEEVPKFSRLTPSGELGATGLVGQESELDT